MYTSSEELRFVSLSPLEKKTKKTLIICLLRMFNVWRKIIKSSQVKEFIGININTCLWLGSPGGYIIFTIHKKVWYRVNKIIKKKTRRKKKRIKDF